MKKRIFSLMLAVFLVIPCAFLFGACSGTDNGDGTETNAKVMNVSLNPELEFILDQNDKVLTVNALNEDGNNIISIAIDAEKTFEGLTADEAINLFLDITKDNGYLITGSREEISIKISGEAEELLKKVENKAKQFFIENEIDVVVIPATLKKADIVNELQQCVKEYSKAELEKMTEAQLIDLLKGSREETKNLLTQELKEAYYDLRLEKINTAELQSLSELVARFGQFVENSEEFATLMGTLNNAVTALETVYQEQFLAEDSPYNIAKQAYIDAKKTLLARRLELIKEGLTEDEHLILDELAQNVATAEAAWNSAKATAELAIQEAKSALNKALNDAKSMAEVIKEILKPFADLTQLLKAKENMREGFKDYFAGHDQFKDFLGRGHWQKA